MKPELDDREHDHELIRLGWALLRITYHRTEDEAGYLALVAAWTDEDIEEAWALVAGLLLSYLADHGKGLGCGCGSPQWLDRVILGEAGH
jgi:hypothetical protein